jgi:hypothetical protein
MVTEHKHILRNLHGHLLACKPLLFVLCGRGRFVDHAQKERLVV